MKRTSRIFIVIVSFIIIFCTFNNNFVYAEDNPSWKVDQKFSTDDWNPKQITGDILDVSIADKKVNDIGKSIIGPIQVIGSLVSVIAIIIIGIRYMLGSVEEKAQYKETLGPYFLGAILVFGITNILAMVYDIANSI